MLINAANFANKRIKLLRLKPPSFVRDEEGNILHMGNLVAAWKTPDNNIEEIQIPCTRELFTMVYKSKAWRAINQSIELQFNNEGLASKLFFKSSIPERDKDGSRLIPNTEDNAEIDLKGFVDLIDTIKDKEVLVKILPEANEKGLKVQLIESDEDIPETILSEILTAVNTAALANTKIQDKDILEDKYMILKSANNGTYIYVRANPLR